MGKNYLKLLLHEYYYKPSQALSRAIEAKAFYSYRFEWPVLDLGCGDGTFSSILFDGGCSIGLDISKEAISQAKRRGTFEGLVVADSCHMPFKYHCFATVFSSSTIEHICDVDATLREVFRVLKKNGKFIFTVPSEKFGDYLFVGALLSKLGLHKLALLYIKRKNRLLNHIHILHRDLWADKLALAGLTLTESQYCLSKNAEYIWDVSGFLTWFSGATKFLFQNVALRRLIVYILYGVYRNIDDPRSNDGGVLLIVAIKK